MIVLITGSGRVEQRVLEVGIDVDEATLSDIRTKLNALVAGHSSADIAPSVAEFADTFGERDRPLVRAIASAVLETLVDQHEERIVLGGTANLTRFGHDFSGSIYPVLEALEEQMVLLRLLGEATGADSL